MTVRVLAHSSNDGAEIATLEVTLHRYVLAELNTHRVFSRNSASSRAIPIEKMLERVKTNPAMPVHWGANQSGMQAKRELNDDLMRSAQEEWLAARDSAVAHVERLLEIGLHKQLANRILEPWMWQTVILTSTEWSNFFALRCHPDAQPEIRVAAETMRVALKESKPKALKSGEWHLPLIRDEDRSDLGYDWETLVKVSAGRCARVSYLTHDGRRDLQADIDLHDSLVASGHMSPLEHQARPSTPGEEYEHWLHGNFDWNWVQYRKTIAHESDFSARPS